MDCSAAEDSTSQFPDAYWFWFWVVGSSPSDFSIAQEAAEEVEEEAAEEEEAEETIALTGAGDVEDDEDDVFCAIWFSYGQYMISFQFYKLQSILQKIREIE